MAGAERYPERERPERRYASFVVRGGLAGAGGTVEVAHVQSGERLRAGSVCEAIGWMQTQAAASPVQDASRAGCTDRATELVPVTKGGERRPHLSIVRPGARDGAAA